MDASHDDYTSSNAETEPTPVPSPIGPPPPHQLPTSPLLGWSDSDNADDDTNKRVLTMDRGAYAYFAMIVLVDFQNQFKEQGLRCNAF